MTFQTPGDPVAAAQAANDSVVRTNGQRSLTALGLHTVLAAIIGAVSAVGGTALLGGPNVVLSPGGNFSVCVGGGASVTLPAGAKANAVETVENCAGDASVSSPITVLASSDAQISFQPLPVITQVPPTVTTSSGVNPTTTTTYNQPTTTQQPFGQYPSFPLIIAGEVVSFRKTAAGTWVPE